MKKANLYDIMFIIKHKDWSNKNDGKHRVQELQLSKPNKR